ncbi:MAG: hypothetical protein WD096_08615 [Actinomycetota bacterium]
MSRIDDELTRRIRSFDISPRPDKVVEQIVARHRKVAMRRHLSVPLLAMSVLVGTLGGYVVLSRAFDDRGDDPARAATTGINGPFVTVVLDTHRTSQLFLYPELDAGGRAITPASHAFIFDPAASPDGRSIAYVRSPPILGEPTEGELVILDLTSDVTTVVANGLFSDPTWAPDGRSIAATLDGEVGIGIVVIDVASGESRSLAAGTSPSWSPDGTTIAYEVPVEWRGPMDTGVFVVPAAGGTGRRIVDNGSSPTWSPDGSRIAYVLGGTGIWTANPAGGESKLVVGTEPGGTAQDPTSTVAHVGWSPDGSYLTYTAETDTGSRILADPLDGPVPIELPPGSNYAWLPQADPPLDFPGTDRTVDGVDYPVCRVMQIAGDFGSEVLDAAWVFQEEHTPGQGCAAGEGFQHLAIGSATRVEVISDRLTACSDGSDCWPAAAVDLDGDGVDEIAVGAGWRPGYMDLVFYRLAHHDDDSVTLERIGAACGATENCISPVYFSIDVNPGSETGLYCGSVVGPPTDGGLVTWQLDEDGDGWMFQQYELTPDGFALDPRAGGVTHGHPSNYPGNDALDVGHDGESLCGEPLMQLDDFDPERAREIEMQQDGTPEPPSIVGTDAVTAALCDVSSQTGELDGDSVDDAFAVGTVPDGAGECPFDGERVLRIDLASDGSIDLERAPPACSPWCVPYAIVDVSGDGVDEILMNEGHTAPPVSAVIGVYVLVDGDLEPVPFPDGTNRFPLVNSYQGYFGAYCEGMNLVTWEGEFAWVAPDLYSLTFRTYALDPDSLRFNLIETTRSDEPAPLPGRTGWDSLCGTATSGFG